MGRSLQQKRIVAPVGGLGVIPPLSSFFRSLLDGLQATHETNSCANNAEVAVVVGDNDSDGGRTENGG